MTTEAEKVFQQIEALPPHEQLVLAAGLLENRKPELAYKVLSKVKEELGAWLALQGQKDRDAESLKLRKEADALWAQGDKRGATELHEKATQVAQRERLD